MSAHLSEQEIIRRNKLEKLESLHINPYPAALYPVSHYSADIKQYFSEENKRAVQQCLRCRQNNEFE